MVTFASDRQIPPAQPDDAYLHGYDPSFPVSILYDHTKRFLISLSSAI